MVQKSTSKRQIKWKSVSNRKPCKICGQSERCSRSEDNSLHCCRGEVTEAPPGFVLKKDTGDGCRIWGCMSTAKTTRAADSGPARATADQCHAVYVAFMDALGMSKRHAKHLKVDRQLTEDEIQKLRYRSWGPLQWPKMTRRAAAAAEAAARKLGIKITSVPGFVRANGRIQLLAPPGMLIPVCDVDGRIVAIKVRVDSPKAGSRKYLYASSASEGGPSPGAPVHVPRCRPEIANIIRITEGPIKSDIATLRTGILTLSIPGVTTFRSVLRVLQQLQPETVLIAFDADFREKRDVARCLIQLVLLLQLKGYEVIVETWPLSKGKGLDDLLVSGGKPRQRRGSEIEELRQQLENQFGEFRHPEPVEINVFVEFHRVNDLCVKAVGRSRKLFNYNGIPVRVVAPVDAADATDDDSRPRIVPAKACVLEHELSRYSNWTRYDEATGSTKPARLSRNNVGYLVEYGELPGLRPLRGLAPFPITRDDSSINLQRGYDTRTQLFQSASFDLSGIPSNPNEREICRAVKVLKDIVRDFPFANEVSRSAWLALLFTMLIRHLIDGPIPLFLVYANTAGAGKGLLVEAISLLVSGSRAQMSPMPTDDAEMKKTITALVLSGATSVVFDNIRGRVEMSSLEAAITSGRWKDRQLGTNSMVEGDFRLIVIATANNPELSADATRRAVSIRLESPHENPDLREDFTHADLRGWITRNRPKLLAAALTIVRGYIRAGRPAQKLVPWGSFEAWSNSICGMLVWAGCEDPGAGRQELRDRVDTERECLAALLETLDRTQSKIRHAAIGFGVEELLAFLRLPLPEDKAAATEIQNALAMLSERDFAQLSSAKVGKLLKKYDGRVLQGRRLVQTKSRNKSLWAVANVDEAVINAKATPLKTQGTSAKSRRNK